MSQPKREPLAAVVDPPSETLVTVEITAERRRGREYVAYADAVDYLRAAYLAASSTDATLVMTLARK